jgi:hypothetical protein
LGSNKELPAGKGATVQQFVAAVGKDSNSDRRTATTDSLQWHGKVLFYNVLCQSVAANDGGRNAANAGLARSERFELPTLGIEIRCSIQLSYERVRRVDYQTWPGRASSGMSVAGMPLTVLADIGRRALTAEDGGGTVIIGEGAGLRAGPVIVQVADRVGQPPIG